MSKAFGVETPTSGEDAVSWQTWSDGAAGIPDVDGDADWGKLKLDESGEEGRSAVYDHGSAIARTYTLTEHRYGVGDTEPVLQIRGSAASFSQDDVLPLWEVYSAPITRTWQYVQIRESTLLEAYLMENFGSDLIAYLSMDEASGTTLNDVTGNSRNGTVGGVTGPTLGVAGIGDTSKAVSFPASAAYIDWYSTSLRDAFDPAEGTLLAFVKVSAAGVWSDGTLRYIARLRADDNNQVRLGRSSSNNNMVLCQHIAGGTSRFTYIASNAYTGWLMYGIEWSAAGSAVYAIINGGRTDNLGAPGSWSGDISSSTTTIGAGSTSSTEVWSGSEAHIALFDRPLTALEILNIFRSVNNPVVFSIIGDSIAVSSLNKLKWIDIVRDGHNGGGCAVVNHAVTGQTIIAHMDAQVVAAADDNADIIIMQLGTNDESGVGIQAEVEENIIELKASNPNATLYYMNVLPRWTDETGDTEVDKSYIRTPVAAACTAQSITCWDTYTDPWIDAADTTDGLHPNDAGYVKIAAEILARI